MSIFQRCIQHAKDFEALHIGYYSNVQCLKQTGTGVQKKTFDSAFEKLKEVYPQCSTEEFGDLSSSRNLCVLPKNHTGACSSSIETSLFANKTLCSKFDWIYTTPGNDDYIYKNRASRAFPIRIPDVLEKELKNKDVKLKCAIPLSQASTPFMMATAYLDYLTLIFNVRDIEFLPNPRLDHLKHTISQHKIYLQEYYKARGRRIFNDEGFTVCPVRQIELKKEYFENSDIKNMNSIQLGHVLPQNEAQFTIRGSNVLFMTRRGNLMVGDSDFLDDEWITEMENTVRFQRQAQASCGYMCNS
jgi:hypothetical protein